MVFQLILGLLLTILPITELRIGLPLVFDYCLKNNIFFLPFFLLVLILNILVIFIIFFFLDYLHKHFLKWKFYNKIFHKVVDKLRRKHEKFENKFNQLGYLALILFVAIPFPGTGAWTGSLFAWLLGLERKRAIPAIATGVIIAGLLILFIHSSSLTLIGLFNR